MVCELYRNGAVNNTLHPKPEAAGEACTALTGQVRKGGRLKINELHVWLCPSEQEVFEAECIPTARVTRPVSGTAGTHAGVWGLVTDVLTDPAPFPVSIHQELPGQPCGAGTRPHT